MTGRILYESVDLSSPSGGIRRLYRHVEILNKYGLRASVLHHRRGFKPGWFATNAPVEYWDAGFTLNAGDILVIPEGHTDVIKATANAGCERVVIALNWANIYARLPIGKDWRDYGIRHVIAGSQYERQFILQSMGLDSTVLASGTNTDLFRPAARKKLQIAYMPRKNAEVFHILACTFRCGYPQWNHVPFVPIDSVSHDDVARVMSESAVFLATSFPEGLARPPLEAMASECVVVGFAGRGSLEYMEHGENCYRAEDADVLTLAEYLHVALERIVDGRAEPMKAAARKTAGRYSLEREEQAVITFWRRFLAERQGALHEMSRR
jgi:glycosyltransferase involved in cell wall biosynthesis